MKQRWAIRLFALILCLSFLFLLPLPTFGEDPAPTVRIAFHNLAFGNQVYLLYAVEVLGAGDAEPFMEVRTTDDLSSDPVCVLSCADDRPLTEQDETVYHIFAYTDLTARQMADVFYVRAGVQVGETVCYSEVDSYSICEYAARQLGFMTGYSGTDENLKNMLQAMLDYGTAAQQYFGYRTDSLANDVCRKFSDNGKLTPTAGVRYQDNKDGTATVIGYESNDENAESSSAVTSLVIAATYEGAIVTNIASNAFSKCGFETVYVPGTVKEIGTSAFSNCKNLKVVTLENGVTKLGEKLFEGCKSLERVIVPTSVDTMERTVFPDATKLVIDYQGTKAQWNALVARNATWNDNGEEKIVQCSDGTIEEP